MSAPRIRTRPMSRAQQEKTPRFEQDLALARAALGGSAEARQVFVQRMGCVPRFLAAQGAHRMLQLEDGTMEELVQEVLTTIWRRLDSYRGLASLETWAYAFCHNALLSELRKRSREPRQLDELELEEEGRSGDRVATWEAYEDVYQALDRIADRDAAMVRYRHFDQLEFSAIAQRMEIPLGTVKDRYYQALKRLRDMLESKREELGW